MQIKFHYVKFKNILSYGNSETTFDLSSYRHSIITGANGFGKCVDKSTEIDIDFDNEEVRQLFLDMQKQNM